MKTLDVAFVYSSISWDKSYSDKLSNNITYLYCGRNTSPKNDGLETLKQETSSVNGDLKRKQKDEVSEAQYPNKSQRNFRGQKESSNQNYNCSWQKQPKKEKLDWNVLRPPKSQGKKKQ